MIGAVPANSSEQLSLDPRTDIARNAAQSGGFMLIAKSMRFAFLLLVNFLLVNLLVPADFGIGRYVLLVVGIANLLNEMGLATAIVQRETLTRENLWPLFCVSFLWSLILYTGIFISAPAIASYFKASELVTLLRTGALMIPVTGISAIHRAWLRRMMWYGKLAIFEMVAAVVSAAGSIIVAFSGGGVWAIVVGYLLFEGVNSILLLITFRFPVNSLRQITLLIPVLFFGIGIIGSRIVDYLTGNVPFFLIGKVIGKEGLGLFSVVYDMALFPQMAINAVLGNVIISIFSRVQADHPRTITGFHKLVLAGAFFTLPILLIMTLLPREVLHVISMLNTESVWLDAAPLLQWLAVMGLFYVFTTFSNAIWLSQGKVIASIGVSVFMCITIVAAVTVGISGGLVGVAKAMFIRACIVFPVAVYLNVLITRIPATVFIGALVPSVVAGGVFAFIVVCVRMLLPGSTLFHDFIVILIGAIIGIAGYVAVFQLLFRSSLQTILAMIRPLIFQPFKKRI